MNNLKIETKLKLLVVIPLVGLLLLGVILSYDRYDRFHKNEMLNELVILASEITHVLHETQKERGMTAIVLSSKGKIYKDRLTKQRSVTNEKILTMKKHIDEMDTSEYGKKFELLIQDSMTRVAKLSSIRNQVDAFQISAPKAITYYVGMNNAFLEAIRSFTAFSLDNDMTQRLLSFSNILVVKERAGVERALGALSFVKNKMPKPLEKKFNAMIAEQNAYLNTFKKLIPEDTLNFYNQKMKNSAISEVKRMREELLSASAKHEIISSIRESVGYGGIIYNFKNYILRAQDKYAQGVSQQYKNFLGALKKYEAVGHLTTEEKSLLKQVKNVFSSYNSGVAQVRSGINQNQSISQLDRLVSANDSSAISALNKLAKGSFFADNIDTWFNNITQKINLYKEVDMYISDKLRSESASMSSSAELEMYFFIVISSGILLGAIVFGRTASKNILEGVQGLHEGIEEFFKFLNQETKEAKHIALNRKDEIGVMADKINEYIVRAEATISDDTKFLVEIKEIVDQIKKGYLYQRLEADVQSKNLQELKSEINEMLEVMHKTVGGSVNKITDVLNSYSDLDFTNNIKNASGHVETSILNVGNMITEMLTKNTINGLTIEQATKELLSNVDGLSRASTETAASLEEAAAALEEITGSIKSNTQNTTQMSSNAKEVMSSVKTGQQLAVDTTKAMDEINGQVSSISEAITVIDQIAFQTNILSLNAAVEAATAGEAGKGFAVVAQEVRNLASRSAEAATEIKTLVENATVKADEGKTIADKMINGYNKLNENITQTIDLIEDVASASMEQNDGINQINSTISSLDMQTQKNASTANETTDIAQKTMKIALDIVADADDKKFIGKESIQV